MPNLPTTFYIVRHGETEWNTKQLLQGHADSPLTKNGEEQVEKLAKRFAVLKFDYVFSSDLLRAKRTAELLTIEKKLAINTTQLLRERSFGKYEGKPREIFQAENKELIKKYESLSQAEQWKFKYAQDMESSEEIIGRLLTFLRETAVTYEGKNILVVTHGGTIRTLLKHLGSPLGSGLIANTAYVKVESDGIEFTIKETQGISHE